MKRFAGSSPVAIVVLLAATASGCRRAPPGDQAQCRGAGAHFAEQLVIAPIVATGLPRQVHAQLREALEWWAQCASVGLTLRPEVERALPVPFTLTLDQLGALSPIEQQRALLGPVLRLVESIAPRGGDVLPVVLLADLAPPDSAAASVLPDLSGLALPRGHLSPDQGEVILLSWERLARLSVEERAAVWEHELGHLFGLPHDARPGNRMNPRCPWPGALDDRQRETIRWSSLAGATTNTRR